MSFKSETYRVLIASPSDLGEERQAATEAVNDWNAQHAAAEAVVLLPVKWETQVVGGGVEYAHLLRDAALRQQLPPAYLFVPLTTSRRPLAARILACQRAWARHGWRPYERWRRFGWSDGDLTITPPPEEEAP
jgi:hypothetical protein